MRWIKYLGWGKEELSTTIGYFSFSAITDAYNSPVKCAQAAGHDSYHRRAELIKSWELGKSLDNRNDSSIFEENYYRPFNIDLHLIRNELFGQFSYAKIKWRRRIGLIFRLMRGRSLDWVGFPSYGCVYCLLYTIHGRQRKRKDFMNTM